MANILNLPWPFLILAALIILLAIPTYGLLLLRMVWHAGWVKWACCKMGWHSPSSLWEYEGLDGCSAHCRCPWCGGVGMVDSQGNLFSCKYPEASKPS